MSSRFVVPVLRPRLGHLLLAGVAALLVVPWVVAPASAQGDVLKATPPQSPPFINSPASYNICSGPATVVFTTQVRNLTKHVVSFTVDINVHHVLTYYGLNVADGQPSKVGITFKPGDAPHTTQVTYGTPFQMKLTVQPKGAAPQLVTFSTVMTAAGYYQFDIGKHFKGGVHENLSSGFARVLGCKHSGGGGGGGTGGTGGVSGATATGQVLAATGFPAADGAIGALLILIGGFGLLIASRRLRVRRR